MIIAMASAAAVGATTVWYWGLLTFLVLMFISFSLPGIFLLRQDKNAITVEEGEKIEELLDKLEMIGHIKNSLPFSVKGLCNGLGLYVQLNNWRGRLHLQAGGKPQSQIDAFRDSGFADSLWRLRRYEPGDWENLVEPTLNVAHYLESQLSRGGLTKEELQILETAINRFKDEGVWELPEDTQSE
jgi:hypothetical protein